MEQNVLRTSTRLAITELYRLATSYIHNIQPHSPSLSQAKAVRACCLLIEQHELQFCIALLILGISYATVIASLRLLLRAGVAVFVLLRMAAKGLTAHYFFAWG